MSNNDIVKEQLWHLIYGTIIFVVLASVAVGLDLAANAMLRLGVSSFTHKVLALTAHSMLVVDTVLFFIYLATSSVRLIKEMLK